MDLQPDELKKVNPYTIVIGPLCAKMDQYQIRNYFPCASEMQIISRTQYANLLYTSVDVAIGDFRRSMPYIMERVSVRFQRTPVCPVASPVPAATPEPAVLTSVPAVTKPVPAVTTSVPAVTTPVPAVVTSSVPAVTTTVPTVTAPVSAVRSVPALKPVTMATTHVLAAAPVAAEMHVSQCRSVELELPFQRVKPEPIEYFDGMLYFNYCI